MLPVWRIKINVFILGAYHTIALVINMLPIQLSFYLDRGSPDNVISTRQRKFVVTKYIYIKQSAQNRLFFRDLDMADER